MKRAVRWLGYLGLWGVAALLLLWQKRATFTDPHYWDALGCYAGQARFLAAHGFDWAAYRQLEFMRPPGYTGLLALVIRLGGADRGMQRAATCVLGALALPAVYALTRRLGGATWAAVVAVALCALSPLYMAQLGLLQCDLPAMAWGAVAWALLLSGQRLGFVVAASLAVLSKESAYFLCLPAAVYLYGQAVPVTPLGRLCWLPLDFRAVARSWPAVVPGLVLLAWELLHQQLFRFVIYSGYAHSLGPNHLIGALVHNFIENGRFLLVPLALVPVRRAWAEPGRSAAAREQRLAILCTGLAVVALPFLFPGPLPRYMLLSLPMLCALAALGIERLGFLRQTTVAAAICAYQVLSWSGKSWHTNQGHHIDANLSYRRVVMMQRQAAQALAAARPHLVAATFPMYSAIVGPPDDGFLSAPLPAQLASPDLGFAELCRSDYLIEAEPGDPVHGPIATLVKGGAQLELWRRFTDRDEDSEVRITIYRIRCGK